MGAELRCIYTLDCHRCRFRVSLVALHGCALLFVLRSQSDIDERVKYITALNRIGKCG